MFFWLTQQLDVKNIFLYGHLKEAVHMAQPPWFLNLQHLDYVASIVPSMVFYKYLMPDLIGLPSIYCRCALVVVELI